MDRSGEWPWGLLPFLTGAEPYDIPASGYGGTDHVPPLGVPSLPGGDHGYGAPTWAHGSVFDQPPLANSAFPGYYPSAPYCQVPAPGPVYPGYAPMGGAGQEVMPPYSYLARGESSRAEGSHGETTPVGQVEYSGAYEAGRRADSSHSDMAAALQIIRESHEGHLAVSREALRSSADAAHYSSQLGAAHEALEIDIRDSAHALELDSTKWQGFINGVVGMLQANTHMYLCTSFLHNHQVPPDVMAILEPFIALVPLPGPIMNFLVNGVSF